VETVGLPPVLRTKVPDFQFTWRFRLEASMGKVSTGSTLTWFFTEKIFKESFKVHTFEVVALLFTAPITCLFCSMAYQLETRLVIKSFLTVS
jgi:hypothetical protein